MLGALLTGAYFLDNDFVFPFVSAPISPIVTSTANTTRENGSASVSDQNSGDTVTVKSVTVPPPGVWVAVREVKGNELGNVLGAVRVNGPRSSFEVPLLRATEPSRSYAIELYRDDGEGTFDINVNSVYVDFDTGAPVILYFSTTN